MSESVENLEKIAARAARRQKLQEAYKVVYNNPFRTKSAIFDPALFRYEAARAYTKDFAKYNPRSFIVPVIFISLVVLIQKSRNSEKRELHRALQNGEKTYYERALWSTRALW